jgi:hypothetical protein
MEIVLKESAFVMNTLKELTVVKEVVQMIVIIMVYVIPIQEYVYVITVILVEVAMKKDVLMIVQETDNALIVLVSVM